MSATHDPLQGFADRAMQAAAMLDARPNTVPSLLSFTDWLAQKGESVPRTMNTMGISEGLQFFMQRQTEYLNYVAEWLRAKNAAA